MSHIRRFGCFALALCCTGAAVVAQESADSAAADRRGEIDAKSEQILEQLFEERDGARDLYDKARGYAVFTATKAGFLVTGGAGTGVAVDKESGKRTYMRMGTGGVGFGIGAQRYQLVIFFESQPYLDRFIEGGWNASASAQAAAGQEGITLTSSFIGGVVLFQLTDRGLMAQADVSGTRFWAIDDLN